MWKGKKWVIIYGLVISATILIAQGSSRAVTAMAENTPPVREVTIILDPGHGGEDGGAISRTGKPESSYNLEIALRLNDLLHFLGYDTKMIRTADTSVYTKGNTIAQKKVSDLKERVRIVNETKNALLLSIHQNQFSDGRYSGAQVFYGKGKGSESLAKALQSAFIATLNPGSHRQAKKGEGIYLMEHIQSTGVLIECGFLSNAAEEANLRNPDYQKKLCCVISTTVSTFLSNT